MERGGEGRAGASLFYQVQSFYALPQFLVVEKCNTPFLSLLYGKQ